MSHHEIELFGGPHHGTVRAVTDETFESGWVAVLSPRGGGRYLKPDTDGPWTWAPAPDRKPQDDIEREMAYTDYQRSCQDAHVTPEGELRECRRAKRHAMPHASGYGKRHVQWFDKP